ncbi:MAG: restriction endonuclease subunit S [Cetobacterium sp.]
MKELKEGWKKDKLENLTNYIARGIPPKYSENLNDMIVINQKCIRDGKLSLKDSRYHNYSLKKVAEEKILKKYDILINSTGVGTLGRVCQNLLDNENLIVDTHVTIVRPNLEKINPIYLGFAIRNNQKFIESLGEGSTGQTELKRQRLADEVEIFYPEHIETQEKIASILSALDNKIEINNEMNKTLEEMAQTLFKRWFIDFDFPNENGEPYRSSGGKMVDSELGESPEGWEVTILGDLFKFVKGKKPKIVSESFSEETPLKYLTIKGFNGDENLYASEDKTILIDKKDIVMVMDGASSGDVYIGKSGVLGSTFSKIEKTKEINWSYIYLILKYYENDIKSHTTGSAIPHTDKGYVEKIRVSLPNLELLNFLSKELSGIIKRKLINQEEIQSLTEIRDILLPKLMNGEIEV